MELSVMNKLRFVLLAAAVSVAALLQAEDNNDVVRWSRAVMDGSRTGVTVPAATDVDKALGKVRGREYTAPSGRVFRGGSVVRVARAVIDAQPSMSPVKRVIAYSPEAMVSEYPESALSNWFADNLMRATEKAAGRKVDISIGNFGGIRVDMPSGDVTVDDIRSMFPFRNDLVYLVLRGSDVRHILDWMAENGFQVLGGVKVAAKDGKIVSAEIDGKPLDDNALYGVATVSFLLDGGDGLYLARNAVEEVDIPVDIYNAMLDVIEEDTAAGRQIEGRRDGRVLLLD